MKYPKDERCLEAFHKWEESEAKYASDNAYGMVACELADSPEMTPIEQLVFFALRESGIEVKPQFQIGKYRVDFMLGRASGQVVIECDGHDFHEKTKEQAQKDKERDRTLQAAGFKVYRFTGSEIWKTSGHCVFTVVDVTDC